MKVPFFLSLILIVSCLSPKQKFDRLIKKHPEFVSTKIIADTFIVPGESDSVITKLVFRNLKIDLEGGKEIQIKDGKMVPDSFTLSKPGVFVKVLIDTSSIGIKVEYQKKELEHQTVSTKGKRIKSTAEITDSTLRLFAKVEHDTVYQLLECPEYKSCTDADHKELKVTWAIIGSLLTIGLMLIIVWLFRKVS